MGACGGAKRVVVRSGVVGAVCGSGVVVRCGGACAVRYRLAIQLGDEVREQQEPAYGEREWTERGRLHDDHHHALRGKDLR